MFIENVFIDHCIACIALSWNDNVLSAYRIAFVGERERGRKQRDFAIKNAIRFVSQLIKSRIRYW